MHDSELPPESLSAVENAATNEIVHFLTLLFVSSELCMYNYVCFLQALQVLTPVKESRSDFDLKNLLQTGNSSKRRNSALILSRPKNLASEEKVHNCRIIVYNWTTIRQTSYVSILFFDSFKPLLAVNCHQNAEDDLSDDEQNQKVKNKQLDMNIAQVCGTL